MYPIIYFTVWVTSACRNYEREGLSKAFPMKKIANNLFKWFIRLSGIAGLVTGISYYLIPSTRDAFHHPLENIILGTSFLVIGTTPIFKEK